MQGDLQKWPQDRCSIQKSQFQISSNCGKKIYFKVYKWKNKVNFMWVNKFLFCDSKLILYSLLIVLIFKSVSEIFLHFQDTWKI